jgi:hypothetical protein
MTRRGGSHLGHTWACGRGRVDCVTVTVEDCWDTCLGRGTHACGALLTAISMVEPQNHPTPGFAEFGPQNSMVRFQRESEAACGVIEKGASRRSNFTWRAGPSDHNRRSWFILPTAKWICSIYLGVV